MKLRSLAVLFTLVSVNVFANSPFPTGGIVVPLRDSLQPDNLLPDIQKDSINIYLLHASIPREIGWLSNDNTLGFSFDINIDYSNITKAQNGAIVSEPRSLSITRAYNFDVKRTDDGVIHIPLLNLPLITDYRIFDKEPDNTFYRVNDVVTKVHLLRIKGRSELAKTLETIFDVSKQIPIPTPYATGVNKLGDIFSNITNDAVNDGGNPESFSIFGTAILPGVQNVNITQRGGLLVLLMSTDKRGDGCLDIGQIKTYGDKLSYSDSSGLSISDPGKYSGEVKNAYLVFRVVFTTDPLIAFTDPIAATAIIKAQADSAIATAEKFNLDVSDLKFAISDINKNPGTREAALKVNPEVLQKALKSINASKTMSPQF